MVTVAVAFPQVCASLTSQDLADFNLVFINGVKNTAEDAKKSAGKTDVLLGLPDGTVQPFYNASVSLLTDLLETYRLSGLQNSATDTELFWKWSRNIASAPISFQSDYWNIASNYDNPLAGGALAAINLDQFDADLKTLQATKRKTVIISHSEGNYFANMLVSRITAEDQALGQDCTGVVAVATPSTWVANGDPWVTNTNDSVINSARIVNANILGGNVTVSKFNSLLNGDVLGHAYVGTYLGWAGSGIESELQAVVNRINQACVTPVPCGQTVNAEGGTDGYSQIHTLGTEPGTVELDFEAYSIPDAIRVTAANGSSTKLADSNGLVSGYHVYKFNCDPSALGSTDV